MKRYSVYFPVEGSLRESVLAARGPQGPRAEPHVSLYVLDSESSLDEITQGLVAGLPRAPVRISSRTMLEGESHNQLWGPYSVSLVENTVGVFGMHMHMLESLQGFMDKSLEDRPEEPGKEDAWEMYGSVNFGPEHYNPHLTVAKGVGLVGLAQFCYDAQRIGVSVTGDGVSEKCYVPLRR